MKVKRKIIFFFIELGFFYFQLKTKHFYYEMSIKINGEIKTEVKLMFTAGDCHSKKKL